MLRNWYLQMFRHGANIRLIIAAIIRVVAIIERFQSQKKQPELCECKLKIRYSRLLDSDRRAWLRSIAAM